MGGDLWEKLPLLTPFSNFLPSTDCLEPILSLSTASSYFCLLAPPLVNCRPHVPHPPTPQMFSLLLFSTALLSLSWFPHESFPVLLLHQPVEACRGAGHMRDVIMDSAEYHLNPGPQVISHTFMLKKIPLSSFLGNGFF